MKSLLYLLVFITASTFAQVLEVPEKGMIIKKGETIIVDTLRNNSVILMQDNSMLIVKEYSAGMGRIKYGDDGTFENDTIELVRTNPITGEPFSDWRTAVDCDPEVIFEKCRSENIIDGPYVTVNTNVPVCEDTALGIKSYYSSKELANYSCVVYNVLGQLLFSGKYKEIPTLQDSVLLIQVYIEGKGIFFTRKLNIKV